MRRYCDEDQGLTSPGFEKLNSADALRQNQTEAVPYSRPYLPGNSLMLLRVISWIALIRGELTIAD
jgi:hypothetical protein